MIDADKRETERTVSGITKGYPSTLTNPDQEALREVVKATVPIIADGFALYEKTKSFSLTAAQSRNLDNSLLFDQQAQEIFAMMDTLSEQVRQLGGVPTRSISHTGELHSLERYNADALSPSGMINDLIEDNRHIADSLEIAKASCGSSRKVCLYVTLQEALEGTESRIRLLKLAVAASGPLN